MKTTSLNNKQAPEKSRRHRRHNWMHKKTRQRTYAMAKRVRGGMMKIPKVQMNLVSMLKMLRNLILLAPSCFSYK
jgi:hypothetical protein